MKQHTIFPRLQSAMSLRLTLLSTTLLDELITGFAVIALPLLRDQFGLSYQQIGLLFSVAAVSSMILEPILNLLSDRSSKRWWILGGLCGLVIGYSLAGNVHNFIALLAAFTLIYPATDAAVGLSQAVLIDLTPHSAARAMTRWTIVSCIGDLLSPLAIAAFVALGFGWTALCDFAAITCLTTGLLLSPQHFPHPSHSSDDEETPAQQHILASLRQALRDPLLIRWAILSLLPSMLDEVFIGFSTLYLHDVLHASEILISVIIVANMIAGLLSLLIVDRLLGRVSHRKLLIYLSLITLSGVIGLLSLHSIIFAALALFIVGLGAAGLYPLATAEAYARQPGRSGTVRAVISLGQPFEVALPAIVGLVASRFGALASIALLGSAPLLMLLLLPRPSPPDPSRLPSHLTPADA